MNEWQQIQWNQYEARTRVEGKQQEEGLRSIRFTCVGNDRVCVCLMSSIVLLVHSFTSASLIC